jgi:GTP diphosphokinase / guanosine-3',5'-bis(diphosphate) 3'-diphosphatase
MKLITWQDLKHIIYLNYPESDIRDLTRAYHFANKAHKGVKRRSGEDYIYHCLATVYYLAELKTDMATLTAGMLHDIPEDTSYTLKDIEKQFGKEVSSLVDGVTKLAPLKYRGIERYAENLRKLFVAMSKDLRVILIKLANNLHNIQTLRAQRPDKQLRIATETMEIYAPLANRLGIFELKSRLEDEAFPYVYPKEYQRVTRLVQDRLKNEAKYIDKIKNIVERELAKNSIAVISIEGRIKHIYSLYRKLIRRDWDINKIYDLIALRIVVKSIPDCYLALGTLHNRWTPLKGRIKDYIAQPKPNGYQSLHTSVFTDFGKVIEFQVRDQYMQEVAEYGIAAHSKFKEMVASQSKKSFSWINELITWQKKIKNDMEYIKNIKTDIFQNRIFVFTPHGDVLDLPDNATPIDFAYNIHTDLGSHTTGVRINDHIARLDTILRSGDVVEIIEDKNRKGPSTEWLKIAATNSVQEKIRTQLKKMKLMGFGQ